MPDKKKALYTIVENDGVGYELMAATSKYKYEQLERVFDALVWRLAREPEAGTKMSHPSGVEYRLIRALPVEGAENPTILARYTIDHKAEQVVIDWIKVYPYNDNEAVSPREYDL